MIREEYAAALASAREWVEEQLGWSYTERLLATARRQVRTLVAVAGPNGEPILGSNWQKRIAVLEAIRDGAEVVSDNGDDEARWGGPQWGRASTRMIPTIRLRPAASDEDLI